MNPLRHSLVLVALAGTAGLARGQDPGIITPQGVQSHLHFLLSDELHTRAIGSSGATIAAEYVAAHFTRIGLQPLNGSFFQDVPLRGITTDPASVSLSFEARGARVTADPPAGAVIWPGRVAARIQLGGELVFAGYGIAAEAWAWDDFKGRDLTGRILLLLPGEPPAPPDDPDLFDGRARTHFGGLAYKVEEAGQRGAAGVLLVHDPEVGPDWTAIQRAGTGEQIVLEPADAGLGVPLLGWLSRDLARHVLARAGLDLDELHVQAGRRDFRPVATGVTARARMNNRIRVIESRNVVGLLPGGHPERGDEVVIVTAAYDHYGDDIPATSAGGTSLLLEIAAAAARLEARPDRGLLFMATTGEDAGLLGSSHYVARPGVPLDRTVAAVNLDGASLWDPTEALVVLGLNLSTAADLAARRATELQIAIHADPDPAVGAFFESDHFPFARAGVPALHVGHGLHLRALAPGATRAARRSPPLLDAGVRQASFVFGLCHDLARAAERPRWIGGPSFRMDGPSAR